MLNQSVMCKQYVRLPGALDPSRSPETLRALVASWCGSASGGAAPMPRPRPICKTFTRSCSITLFGSANHIVAACIPGCLRRSMSGAAPCAAVCEPPAPDRSLKASVKDEETESFSDAEEEFVDGEYGAELW